MNDTGTKEEIYQNFFDMLKFWIGQTDKNIANAGDRIPFKEIDETNAEEYGKCNPNSNFRKEYLYYPGFSIRISFFRTGNYRGERVNFVVWRPETENSWWLNILYLQKQERVRVIYRSDVEKNPDPEDLKKYMIDKGYSTPFEFGIADLELSNLQPNGKVKEVFDYFKQMIEDAKTYIEERGNMISINNWADKVAKSHNVIFHGAPGTGKSYLAKQIAAEIISNGAVQSYASLSKEQKEQVDFVQFHPSYDYTDFVEGLRPKINERGEMAFELQDGIFKKFVKTAQINYENSHKSQEQLVKEKSAENMLSEYFSKIEFGEEEFKTTRGKSFFITDLSEKRIHICIPDNSVTNTLSLSLQELKVMLESEEEFERVRDINVFFDKGYQTQNYSYYLPIYQAIKSSGADQTVFSSSVREEEKKFVFIIDEINRGEISKIFGELFFSIDPGYRGEEGAVSTQYSNLHENEVEKFFIPKNVYIIGTMNNIDRSVDSFDFAMRRRFRFIEINAKESQTMLDGLEKKEEIIRRMDALNQKISKTEGLNENYHIGAAYFLKLEMPDFEFTELWTDYLEPLLKDYVRGMYDEESLLKEFRNAYELKYEEVNDGTDSQR